MKSHLPPEQKGGHCGVQVLELALPLTVCLRVPICTRVRQVVWGAPQSLGE